MSLEEQPDLPEGVRRLEYQDKEIYLVGTAHVSKKSVEEVRRAFELLDPDSVAVELCPSRYKAMTEADAWKKMDLFKVIRQGKAVFLLAQMLISSFYRRIGRQLEVEPGAEMLEGVRLAESSGKELVLADRDVAITLRRVWGYLGFWAKMRLLAHMLTDILMSREVDATTIESLRQNDQLSVVMEEFAKSFPEIKARLIDERDLVLAYNIRQAKGRRVLAVIGAGHLDGVSRAIHEPIDIEPLLVKPPKAVWGRIITWSIPVAIVALLVAAFIKGGGAYSLQSLGIWTILTAALAGLGALAAFAHPVTIALTTLVSPVTALIPLVGAGWVGGLVQVKLRPPTVRDFERLPDDISSFKGFWMNPATRVLLVVLLGNLGSASGKIISGLWIAGRVIG